MFVCGNFSDVVFYFVFQCTGVINLGGEIGCLISEGPWIFVGIPNVVKVGGSRLLLFDPLYIDIYRYLLGIQKY